MFIGPPPPPAADLVSVGFGAGRGPDVFLSDFPPRMASSKAPRPPPAAGLGIPGIPPGGGGGGGPPAGGGGGGGPPPPLATGGGGGGGGPPAGAVKNDE